MTNDRKLRWTPLSQDNAERARQLLVDQAQPVYGAPRSDPLPGPDWAAAMWPTALGMWVAERGEGVEAETVAVAAVHSPDDVNRLAWMTLVTAPVGTEEQMAGLVVEILEMIGDRWPLRKVYLPSVAGSHAQGPIEACAGQPEVRVPDHTWSGGAYRDLAIHAWWFDRAPAPS